MKTATGQYWPPVCRFPQYPVAELVKDCTPRVVVRQADPEERTMYVPGSRTRTSPINLERSGVRSFAVRKCPTPLVRLNSNPRRRAGTARASTGISGNGCAISSSTTCTTRLSLLTSRTSTDPGLNPSRLSLIRYSPGDNPGRRKYPVESVRDLIPRGVASTSAAGIGLWAASVTRPTIAPWAAADRTLNAPSRRTLAQQARCARESTRLVTARLARDRAALVRAVDSPARTRFHTRCSFAEDRKTTSHRWATKRSHRSSF